MGLKSALKKKNDRRKFRWKDRQFKVRTLDLYAKSDPLGGANQAKGIVLQKVQKEAKKIVKQGPKHFIFYDLEGKKNEIKYLEPVDFHIVKVW